MWLVRLLIRDARPWARGRQRFMVGPSSTIALSTPSPRTMSTTRRAFIGAMRTKRALAKAPGSSPSRLSRRALTRLRSIVLIVSTLSTLSVSAGTRRAAASAATALPVVLDVPAVGAGRCELAQLVTDHRLGDEHRDVLAAVVHGDRVAEHGRDDHGPPGPRLDDVLGALLVLDVHLLLQVVVHEGTLLQGTRHGSRSPISASCRSCDGGRSSSCWPCSAGACAPRAFRWGSPGDVHQRSCPHRHRA